MFRNQRAAPASCDDSKIMWAIDLLPVRGAGLRRSCVMSVSSEADPEGIRGWCGSRLWWRSPSARRLHQTVRTGGFADATAAPGAYGHAAVAWKPLVGNHAPRSGP
jgi:hypothetical protein